MKLPNAGNAVVDERKVREYLLSPSHPIGRFKARYFEGVGFPPEAWPGFIAVLLQLAAEGEAQMVEEFDYGQKYVVRGHISAPGRPPVAVESVWIIRTGDDTPRLVTVYPR
jgi:hypothetical protein